LRQRGIDRWKLFPPKKGRGHGGGGGWGGWGGKGTGWAGDIPGGSTAKFGGHPSGDKIPGGGLTVGLVGGGCPESLQFLLIRKGILWVSPFLENLHLSANPQQVEEDYWGDKGDFGI